MRSQYFSSNPTIQNWVVRNVDLDYLLDLDSDSKIESNPNKSISVITKQDIPRVSIKGFK